MFYGGIYARQNLKPMDLGCEKGCWQGNLNLKMVTAGRWNLAAYKLHAWENLSLKPELTW